VEKMKERPDPVDTKNHGSVVKKEYTILIADRNLHVRKFLRRELKVVGYRVLLAKNGRQALEWAYSHEQIDIMILDPDLPDAEESSLLIELQNRIPVLPVIFHAFLQDCASASVLLKPAAFVEKGGSSVEGLKRAIHVILQHPKHPIVDEIKKL